MKKENQSMSKKILILGFGNADRQDDGVAWHILSGIAHILGLIMEIDPGDNFFVNRGNISLMFELQLIPEFAETLPNYDVVYFIDAHTDTIKEEISLYSILPQAQILPFTHQMSPHMLLSITQSIYEAIPETFLLSVRAFEFSFSRELSEKTSELCKKAIQLLWSQLHDKIDFG